MMLRNMRIDMRLDMRRAKLFTATFACSALVVSCSSLPSNTDPQVLRTYSVDMADEPTVGPQPGQEPDLLLRDFYSAAAIPVGDYSAARSFLSPDTANSWSPAGEVLLVDAIDLTTLADSSEADTRTFEVRGSVIGSLSGGTYTPQNGDYQAEIVMNRIDGEWRIDDLPQGVVIERTELRNQYQPQSLYFFEETGRALVRDRRWIYRGQSALDSELITLLMQGPSRDLQPAIRSFLPDGAQYLGIEDGVYQFSGLTSMGSEERQRFGAQIVWTLANAGIPGPYSVSADGAELIDGLEDMTSDDFADANPQVSSNTVAPLYAVNRGNLLQVAANESSPVDNRLGRSGDVQSADVSTANIVTAVMSEGEDSERSTLYMGEVDGSIEEVFEAGTLSRPTFELGGQVAWVVADGNTIVRVARSAASGEVTDSEVNSTALDGINGEVSVLRLSGSGARVAMIISGEVYTGIVERQESGESRIVNVRQIGAELDGTALALDWQTDGSIVVGTSRPETPVWRIELDGSAASALPSGNITAPVVAIAASPSTIYITDQRAMLQMPISDTDAVFWREVPGLQGVRSAPVVAN